MPEKTRAEAGAIRGPIRMCAVCKERFAKTDLKRFVLTEGKIPVEDSKQTMPGRGCYICAKTGCQEKWLRRINAGKRGLRHDG